MTSSSSSFLRLLAQQSSSPSSSSATTASAASAAGARPPHRPLPANRSLIPVALIHTPHPHPPRRLTPRSRTPEELARDRDANKPGVYLVPPFFPGQPPTVAFGGCPQTYEAQGLTRLPRCVFLLSPISSHLHLSPSELPPAPEGLWHGKACSSCLRCTRTGPACPSPGRRCSSAMRESGTTPQRPPSNRRAPRPASRSRLLLPLSPPAASPRAPSRRVCPPPCPPGGVQADGHRALQRPLVQPAQVRGVPRHKALPAGAPPPLASPPCIVSPTISAPSPSDAQGPVELSTSETHTRLSSPLGAGGR